LTATNRYNNTDGSLRVYYSYGNHFIDDPKHFHSLDDRFGVLAYQNFTPWHNGSATVGFDFDTYTGKIPMSGGTAHTEGSMSTIGRKSITEYSPYVTLSQGLLHGLLNLNAGLRMANSDMFSTQWVPQGGVAVHPGANWLIKASVAKGYRNPSFRELYLYRTANSDLSPENMMNYEATVGKTFSHIFGIDVTGYYSRGSNLIQTENMKNVNTGSFTNKGVEVSANSHPLRNVTLRASYSYMRTSLPNLTAAPKNQYFFSVAWKALPTLLIDAQLRGVGDLYVAETVANQNYALLDVKCTYNALRYLDLFVTINNITDANYVINRGYEMPGFTAMGGFKLHF
jgi:iron complex outermembrane receptor protein